MEESAAPPARHGASNRGVSDGGRSRTDPLAGDEEHDATRPDAPCARAKPQCLRRQRRGWLGMEPMGGAGNGNVCTGGETGSGNTMLQW